MPKIELKIQTKPKGQPRPRYSARTKRIYNPPTAKDFKDEIALRMKQALVIIKISGAVRVSMVFALEPTKKPDGDNVEKAVLDALRPWFDDRQVVACCWTKNNGTGITTIVVSWDEE